jgi:hypothetical protein
VRLLPCGEKVQTPGGSWGVTLPSGVPALLRTPPAAARAASQQTLAGSLSELTISLLAAPAPPGCTGQTNQPGAAGCIRGQLFALTLLRAARAHLGRPPLRSRGHCGGCGGGQARTPEAGSGVWRSGRNWIRRPTASPSAACPSP